MIEPSERWIVLALTLASIALIIAVLAYYTVK